MKTYMSNKVERKWYLINAEGKTLGRMSTRIADILQGKKKPEFAPHLDIGDEVIVTNAAKVAVTGRKLKQKIYFRYSGYPSGQKRFDLQTMLEKKPEEVIRQAVRGMLPGNNIGRKMLKRLRVYAGPEHEQQAQQPKEIKL